MNNLHFKDLFKILKEENFNSTMDWGNWGNSDSTGDFENDSADLNDTHNSMVQDMSSEDILHSRMYQNPLLATVHNLKDMAKYGQYDALIGNTMQRQKVKTFHKKQIISSKNETKNKNVEIKPWDNIGEEVGVYSDENIFGVKKLIGKGKILRRIISAHMIYAYYLVQIKDEAIIVSAHQIFPLEILNNMIKITNINDRKVKIAPFDNPFSKVEKKEKNDIIRDIKDDADSINQKKEIQKYLDNVDAQEIELDYDEAKALGQNFSFDMGGGAVKFVKKIVDGEIYHKVEEDLNFKEFLNQQNLNECVGLAKKIKDDICLGINRDKVMMPLYVVKRELLNGIEILFIEDKKTGWKQALNQYGICVVNTSMIVNREKSLTDVGDEIVGKTFAPNTYKPNEKTEKLFKILSCKTLDEVVGLFKNKDNRITGHNFITDGEKVFSIEVTLREKMMSIKNVDLKGEAISNHGLFFKKEGFQEKENPEQFLSSVTRKQDAEELLKNTENLFDVLENKKYNFTNPNNIFRSTTKVFTNASIVINSTQKIMQVKLFMDKIEGFCGIENNLPRNYKPVIKIEIDKIYK